MKSRRYDIIVTGLEHVMNDVSSQAEELSARGIETLFYSQETTGWTARDRYQVSILKAPDSLGKSIRTLDGLIRQYRPRHVELYHHYADQWFTIAHTLLTAALKVPLVVVCTGGEILYWEHHSWLRRLAVKLSCQLARLVAIKELYMRDHILKYSITDPNKLLFSSIKVRIQPSFTVERHKRVVLFLNSFKKWRNVELIVQAAPRVLAEFPDAHFLLVGASGRPNERAVANLTVEMGLQDKVAILPWDDNPVPYFERASVFVLPADIVFCNSALLEAMERGLSPIVADVDGAELIVEEGVSGLRVPRNADALAEAILRLFRDESLRRRLGAGARKKVETSFDEKQRADLLQRAYLDRVWEPSGQSDGQPTFSSAQPRQQDPATCRLTCNKS